MKDNISLIAAAAGGFMLSVALAGILHGAPVTALREQSSFSPTIANSSSISSQETNNLKLLVRDSQKS